MIRDEMKVQGGYWIPCDVAKPPKSGMYTVTGIALADGTPKVARINYEKDIDLWNMVHYKVVAWCGLPEPYKGVK